MVEARSESSVAVRMQDCAIRKIHSSVAVGGVQYLWREIGDLFAEKGYNLGQLRGPRDMALAASRKKQRREE